MSSLIFGIAGLARELCSKCKEETLHKLGICSQCGAEQPWRAKRESLSIKGARCRGIYGIADVRPKQS